MKKKIFSILTAVFIFVVCGVFSACGDRYKDLEFKIYYAFSEEATEWHDASQGIVLNYGGADDEFQIDAETGVGTLYLKVEIANVKSKYIDEIIVTKRGTSGGVNFSSATVDQNEVFSIDITGNTNSSLRFFETNSGKQVDIDLSIYRSLTGIQVDTSIKPAVKVGDTISLMSLKNLYYLPMLNGNTLTNQTGVDYQILGIGYYNDQIEDNHKEFVLVRTQSYAYQYMSISENGVLRVNSDYTINANEYIVRISAVSKHNPSISAEFDVYIVEDQEFSPSVYYSSDASLEDVGSSFTLYNGNDNYSSVTLTIDTQQLASIYKTPINTIDRDGQAIYEICIYVDNVAVDLSTSQVINGLLIESLNESNSVIRLTSTSDNYPTNKIKISYELKDFDFSASNAPNYSREIVVNKSVLPENISINDTLPELTDLQGSMEGIIYSSSSSTYQGLSLTLLAVPTNINQSTDIYISANENVIITGQVENLGANSYIVKSGGTIYIRVASNVNADQTITISTQVTPTIFENQVITERFVEISYRLRKVVTADSIDIYADENLTTPINNGSLNIDARNSTDAYLKVYYTGTTLETSSISLESDNTAIRFENNSTSILLNDPTVERVQIATNDANGKYDLFRVSFLGANAIEKANILVNAGEGSIGVGTRFEVNSVYLLQDDTIIVESTSRNVTTFTGIDNGHFNFAVVKNQLVEFSILGMVQGGNELNDIGIINSTVNVNTDYGNNYAGNNNFSTSAVTYNKLDANEFSLTGQIGSKTTVLSIEVNFYARINNIISLTNKIIYVDIAVYDPISEIYRTITADEIVYINEYYESASTSEIAFSSYASNYSAASNSVVFSGVDGTEIVRADASQLRLEINRDLNIDNTIEIYLVNNKGEEISISDESILRINSENILSGTLRVKLNGVSDYNDLTLSLTALRFGEESNTSISVTIEFAQHEPVDGITLSGNSIVQNGVDSYYVYMSFIDVAENGNTSTSFTATPYYESNIATGLRYDDLTYNLYQIVQDENGNIVRDENGQALEDAVTSARLNISIDPDTHLVTIRAFENLGGGLFRLELASLDSYDTLTQTFTTAQSLFVSISDGTRQNKYVINSAEDLYNINNNLEANYVLRSNITVSDVTIDGQTISIAPIGGEEAFNGTLTGTVENLNSDNEIVTSRYKITLNLKNYILNTNNSVYAGLFARIGANGVISDLDIDVNFDTSNFTSTAGGELNIGAVAGANEGGIIKGVNVKLIGGNQDNINFVVDKISTPINFGGIVGLNEGRIDLSSSNVSADAQIKINTNATVQHNVGLVAGKNSGEIYGGYLGKDSLNNISYSAIANLELINSATASPSLYLGSIVGYNYGGYIHNLIAGGFIRVTDNDITNIGEISGFIGGIAGYSDDDPGSSVSVKGINTVAVLGLDLYADNPSLEVAGIVGKSNRSTITDVRVLASKVTFDQGGLTSYGMIYGEGIVAGIVANSDADKINFASVESFISSATTASGDAELFYMLNSGQNKVAGLVYTASNTTLRNSFISANIDTNSNLSSGLKTIILTSNANETNVYFLGRVNDLDQMQNNIYSRDTNSGYYVVYTDNSIIDFNADTANELDLSNYFNATTVNSDDLYTEQQFLQTIALTNAEFESQKEFLYTLTDGVYTKITSDAIFDENITYYIFDNNLWQNNRASLYVANIEGYLYSLVDYNFDPNTTYYTIENINIRDYYIIEDDHYVKNDNPNININAIYYELTWETDNDWEDTVSSWIGTDLDSWQINSERNFVSIYGMNFYFPYLLDDEGKILMIERPTQIQANVNANFIIEINSSYVDKDYPMQGYEVTSTTIINYHSDVNNPLNNETYNRYNIVNTAGIGDEPNGLVDLNVIPSNAQGGVGFEIVRGSAYAYINSQNQIVFTGVSGADPIIVRCYSLFNDELEEFVVFFTQLGLSDLMLTSNSIYEVEEESVDFELYTHTGANSTLVSISAENIYQGQQFASILDAGINNYLEVEAVSNSTNSILNIVNANSTNGIMIQVEDDEFDGNMTTEMITFTLKLNLTEYFGEEFYPANEGVDQYLDLASTNLRVVVYKTATDIEIEGGDYSVYTNANIDFNVNLYTGYVSEEESGFAQDYIVNNTVMLQEKDKDSINLTMEIVSGQDELDKLLENAGVDYIVELFDFDFYYSLLLAGNNEVQGYQYTIEMNLKDDFNFRYITSSIGFRLTVYGANNTGISDSILITFNPTELSTMRIENYTATSVTTITNYTSLIESNTTETSIISPGGYGGVMMIYLEPSYSNIVSATLTSSSLYIPSLGRNVSIIFEQLVKNEEGDYETVYPNNETIDGGIKLSLVSNVDSNGNYTYDGIIYIHTQMDKFVGMTGTIEARLLVETGEGNTIEQTKTLITEYLPGATLSYNGISVNNSTDEYLIQKDTYNNEIDIRIYGYQFNSNPNISFIWKLNDTDPNYTYDKKLATDINEDNFENRKLTLYVLQSGTYVKCDSYSTFNPYETYYEDNRNILIDKSSNQYNVLDYLSYRFQDNYDQVMQNDDGSYTMTVLLNIYPSIPAGFEMNATLTLATSESLITSEQEDSLIFYPVDYIVTNAQVSNLNNGNLNIAYNRSSAINLSFATNNPNNDLSENIYDKLLQDIGVNNLATLFTYVNSEGTIVQFSDSDELHPEFSINIINGRLTITGLDSFYRTIEFRVHYGYVLENGQYVLKFGTMSSNSLNRTLEFSFTLNIYASTTEENAIPLYSVDDIFDPDTGACLLGEDADYILMNDIVLENLVPIDVDIASFDGNNKVIKIRSFAVSVDRTEYGLFANIGTYQDIDGVTQTTILKNVIVDYSEFNSSLNLTNNDITDIAFGGLVANNNGLIYNCDVLNLGTRSKTINILLDNDSDVEIVFGGLVGINSGIITNSRVGRLGYTKITANENSETSVQVGGSALTFIIGDITQTSQTGQGFVGVTAGFVGENSGTIASSYVANTGITNYSTAPEGTTGDHSITAGFVGENTSTGSISYSYVKALESTISETNPYSTGVEIYSPTNGNVAGFVYLNSGRINNSFANTVLTSTSAYVAGFVYNNQASGVISESYAACTLNGVFTANDASEQPFVGVSNSDELLSYGTLDNTYYLIDDDNSFIIKTENGKDQATGLNQENFANSSSLNGFVFIESNSRTERNQGVWSYYNQNNSYRILPELPNANQIAHSYRYLLRQENSVYIYSNAVSYEPGSANNPNIIRSVEEFNEIMLSGNTSNSLTGYVRFINNIDFASDETAIKTRTNFTLGDINNNSITSIDGNGMTISGIYLDVGNAQEESIGLFAEIHNAYVKNLNLEFATTVETDGQFSSLSAIYSGGLAGVIDNSVIINIDLNGTSTTISGQNFAGGLAGIITGQSLVYGIDSNLSVKAVNTDTIHYYNYYSEQEFNTMRAFGAINYTGNYETYLTQLSFAGGIAGVIDLEARQYVDFNLSYINVYGNEMYDKRTIDANILADYAGGIAGYAGKETSSLRLKYFVGQTNLIRGQFAVGGIFAVSSGDITASQVTAEEDEQFVYDTTLGQYILALENGEEAVIDTANAGNLNLLETYGYGGGLIGISISSRIDSCYSKAGFKVGSTLGGLLGVSIGSNIVYSYAIPYVNVDDTYLTKVGGLIGSAYGVRSGTIDRNQEVSEYINYLTLIIGETNKNTDIQFTFSTILMDINDITIKNSITEEYVNFDYVCADYGQLEGNSTGYITSNNGSALLYVFAGRVGAYDSITEEGEPIVKHSNEARASDEEIKLLYDTSENNVEQVSTFNNIFSGWDTTYWTLNAERYFPLLLNEEAENYIIIETADDFYQLINDPDGSFMIVNDIDMSDWCARNNTNFVFDIEFTGILIGQKEDDTIPILYNLYLSPTNAEDAGLFRETNEATLRNITFKWGSNPNETVSMMSVSSSVLLGNTIDTFGGVSAQDNGSLFSNLTVRVASEESDRETSLFSSIDGTIAGFGGIVGRATNSNILNCTFSGRVDVALASMAMATNNEIHFGGLVADSDIYVDSGGEDEDDANMTIMNSSIGLNNTNTTENIEQTVFNLTIKNASLSYIGGAVGYANNTSVASISVGNYAYDPNYRRIVFNINLDNSNANNYFGGVVGGLAGSQLSTVDAITEINVSGSENRALEDASTTSYINAFAGLVGYYTLSGSASADYSINSSSTSSNLNILGGTAITNLFVSTGVAYAESHRESELIIEQSLFTGTISSELSEDDADSTLNNVYAGGVIAYAYQGTSTNLGSAISLTDVMTTSDIIIGSPQTTRLYAGSLAGQANVVSAVNFASTGRIVPITGYSDDPTNNHFYIGGFIGQANNVNIINAYSLTSIIADSIDYQAIQALNINALFGDVETVSTEYVYYSSDYALFSEESGAGYNLSAYTLTRNNVWRLDTSNGLNYRNGFWAELNASSGSYYLPYIASLNTQLINYGILKQVDYTYIYQLNALTPIVIDDSSSMDILVSDETSSKFTYYILSTNLTNLNFSGGGVLNGILIGGETEYNQFVSTGEYSNTEGSFSGIIPKVSRHSAISNLHIKLATNTNYDIGNGNISGILVGLNEGVIFNSSVQGTGVGIDSGNLGLISGRNSGLISYSYSSLEVVEVSANSIAGIVNQNQGMILSCYFTGYINNTTASEDTITTTAIAAGIVVENLARGTGGEYENNFIFNTYSTGVIESVSADGNSFIADSNGLMGVNNYVDSLANVENINIVDEDSTTIILSTINTARLMSADVLDGYLDGKWYYTTYKVDNNYYLIDRKSETFGYNYLYPTLRIDKIIVDESTDWNDPTSFEYFDNQYQLYTGNGSVALELGQGYEDVINALSSTETELTSNAETNIMRIPHLGLLSAIQSLAIDYGENVQDPTLTGKNTSLYYVLIYDIDGRSGPDVTPLEWNAIGTANENAEADAFYNGSQSSFAGFFVSNKNYDFTDLSLTDACQITGLNNGIFANIKNAYFGYLKLGGGDETLEDSGLLGVNINPSSESETTVDNVIVDKIQILQNTVIRGDGYIGGLFGVISSGNVSMKDFVTYNADEAGIVRPNLTISTAEYAGLITGKVESGNIKLGFTPDGLHGVEGINEINDTFYVRFGDSVNYAGGLIGYIENNTTNINASAYKTDDGAENNKVIIYTEEGGASTIGGIVGAMIGNDSEAIATVSNITVKMNQNTSAEGEQTPIDVNVFGGLIARLGLGTTDINSSTITFENCGLDLGEEGLYISTETNEISDVGNYFGLLAAKVDGGVLNVVDFYFADEVTDSQIRYETSTLSESEEEGESYTTSKENLQGIGMLAGKLSGNANIIFGYDRELSFPALHAINVYNLGGIVGVYESGSIGIEYYEENPYNVQLYGTTNVGGAVGLVGGDTTDINDIVVVDGDKYFNFLTSDLAFATLHTDQQGYLNRYNWGGLFGYYQKEELSYEPEDGPTAIKNNNKIMIGTTGVEIRKYIYNVGGVVGKIGAETTLVDNLENTKDAYIVPEGLDTAPTSWGLVEDKVYNLNTVMGSNSNIANTIRTINVGGVIGYAGAGSSELTITNIKNDSEMILGYQNVGGLVGYLDENTVVTNEELEYSEVRDITAGELYFRLDGEAYELYLAKEDESEELYELSGDPTSTGTVAGVLNVGGAFGIFNGTTAENIWTESNVYGNANVGGFVGYVFNQNTELSNNVVAKSSTDETEKTIVKGVYVAINLNKYSAGELSTVSEMFIPTSVGGFVGTAEQGVLTNNSVFNTTVQSTNEGDISSAVSTLEQNNITISTISNNMLKISMGGATDNDAIQQSDKVFEYYSLTDPTGYEYEIKGGSTTVFNEMSSGFGGFAGTVSSSVALVERSGGQYAMETNKFQTSIDAQLGVNVGTYYGFYYGAERDNSGATEMMIATPELLGNVYVNGGYNIGGVTGQYAGSVNLSQFSLADNAKGEGIIELQPTSLGMYVGGLFGLLQSDQVEGLSLEGTADIKIEINVANTYYSGGLVGKLYVQSDASFKGTITDDDIASGSSEELLANRFGGLLGMLKVAGGEIDGYEVTVKGEHNYPFTINTIENSNYEDGKSTSGVTLPEDQVVDLVAMATYINKDTFNISPSANPAYYDENANNPTRPNDSWGWAIDYTMFKTIQRCIPATENNGLWDSISQVYDASNITYVGTIANLGLTGTWLYGDDSEWTNIKNEANNIGLSNDASNTISKPTDESDKDYDQQLAFYRSCKMIERNNDGSKYKFNPNYICYTIYEEDEGIERLYSAIGIAEPYLDQNGDYVEKPKSKTPTDSVSDFLQWIGAFTGWSDPPTSYYPLLLNYDKDGYDGLTYIDYSSEAKYKVTDRNEYQGFWPSDSSYRDYFCLIKNFYVLNEDENNRILRDETYFMFTYFYTNSTLNVTEDDFTIAGVGDTLADSGSIFEVNGLKSSNFDERMKKEAGRATYPWLKYVQIAIVVASILIGGGGQLLFNAGKAVVKKVTQKIGKITIKKLLSTYGLQAAAATLAFAGIANILLSQALASQSAETVYYGVTNESLGYLGRLYRREIIYDEEGKLLIQVDASAENGQEVQYVYYSNTRPNDYYSHRYYVYVENDIGGYDTIFLDSIESATLQTSGNFEGAYEITYEEKTAYAYEYYIYENGEYYVLLDALETAMVPTQMPIPENLKSPEDYIFTRGSYYVRGKYNGSSYKYDSNNGVIDNAIVYNELTGEYTINDVPWNSSYGAISTTTTLRYIIDKNIDKNDEVEGVINLGDWIASEDLYYYGYGYMKNAYYTAKVNDIGGDKKVGVFSCVGSTAPAGTAGIDYITRTYWEEIRGEDGSITRVPTVYYYTILSISDNSTLFDSAERASGTIAERPNTGDRINVKLYPYSFENPYSNYIKNSQDKYYYFVNTDSDKGGIQHQVTYYYYEGGYITADYNDELLAYKKIGEEGEESSLSKVKNVVLYESDGSNKLYSYKDIYDELKAGRVLYTIDISAYTTNTELYKIENQFKIIKDDEVAGKDYLYQIISDKQISNGKLSTIVFTMPNSNSKDYNENKYLMNEDLLFYTRYKYSGLENEGRDLFGTGAWIYNNGDAKEAFYIYRKDQTIPNAGMKTFLVESSRIILSGIYYDGTSSRSVGGVNMV